MTDQAPELLPCPFCGNKGNLNRLSNGLSWVQCEECLLSSPVQLAHEKAIRYWNTRPPSERPVPQVREAAQRAPKVRTSHHRNKEEAARLQALVDERYAESVPQVREALEREEKYLHALIDDEDVGSVMHGDIEGAFHRLQTALTAERPSEAAVVRKGWRLVYVKRWRTLIQVPISIADEIVAALVPQDQAIAVISGAVMDGAGGIPASGAEHQNSHKGDSSNRSSGSQRPSEAAVAWQFWSVTSNKWLMCSPPAEQELKGKYAKRYRPLYAIPHEEQTDIGR